MSHVVVPLQIFSQDHLGQALARRYHRKNVSLLIGKEVDKYEIILVVDEGFF
jgi:hypothetical protein